MTFCQECFLQWLLLMSKSRERHDIPLTEYLSLSECCTVAVVFSVHVCRVTQCKPRLMFSHWGHMSASWSLQCAAPKQAAHIILQHFTAKRSGMMAGLHQCT